MPIRRQIDLDGRPTSVARARRFVERTLEAWYFGEHLIDVASLLTSEVATNAVLHALGRYRLVVSYRPPELLVEAYDHSRRPPLYPSAPPGDDDPHGRGLLIIDRIASGWGTRPEPGGKAVWFTLSAPGPQAALGPVTIDVATACPEPGNTAVTGSWCDAFAVRDRTCVAIGSVTGDAAAATIAAHLRNLVRVHVQRGESPAEVLNHASRLMRRFAPEGAASAIVATWDAGTRTLLRANAGHPPALCCRAGEGRFLNPPFNPPLGSAPAWKHREAGAVLPPATTVVLYNRDLLEEPYDASGRLDATEMIGLVRALSTTSAKDVCESIAAWWDRKSGTGSACFVAVALP